MKAKTLVQTWLEVELEERGNTLAKALGKLNKNQGTAHTHSRVREWEENRNGRGDRLPRALRVYMAKQVIRSALADAGVNCKNLSTRDLNKLAERFC